jgi:hypothetical protein
MALLTNRDSLIKCRSRLFALWLVLVVSFCCWPGREAQAQNGPSREYQLKAVFLFNFAQFVSWPPAVFADPNAPLVIGVIGDDPFGPYLDETVRGEKVGGHPLVIRRYAQAEDIKDCHILFIGPSQNNQMKEIIRGLKGRCVLTVGETDGFAREGGMVRFVTVENKIHLRINLEAARAQNLTISSRLLRLADIVGPEKN